MDWKREKKLWVCLQELTQTEPEPTTPNPSNREEKSVFGVKQKSSDSSEKDTEISTRDSFKL